MLRHVAALRQPTLVRPRCVAHPSRRSAAPAPLLGSNALFTRSTQGEFARFGESLIRSCTVLRLACIQHDNRGPSRSPDGAPMNPGAFSVSLAVKDIAASRAF